MSPITTLSNPQSPTGQALAGLADTGLQFVGLGLIHSFGHLRDKISPQAEMVIADKADTQIKGLITGKRFETGVNGEIRDLSNQQSPDIEKFVSQQKLRHSDLTNESAIKTEQLQRLTDTLKKTKGKDVRQGLAGQIKALHSSLEDINAERNAIDDAVRPYGGFAQSTEPQTKIAGLLPQYASHTPVEGKGENVPSNINFTSAMQGGRTITKIPGSELTPKAAMDETLRSRQNVLEQSLSDIPDEDKPVIQNEIKETKKAIEDNTKGKIQTETAQGDTNLEKPTQDKGEGTNVSPQGSKEEIQNKPKGLISDDTYNKAKDSFNTLETNISANPVEWYAKQAKNLITMGAYHFQNGLIGFADWSKKMLDEFGDEVKPHLIGIWNQIKSNPSLTQIAKQPDFNPNTQKFFSTESSSQTVGKIAKTLKAVPDWLEAKSQSAFPAIRKFGNESYAKCYGRYSFSRSSQTGF